MSEQAGKGRRICVRPKPFDSPEVYGKRVLAMPGRHASTEIPEKDDLGEG